VGQYFNNNYISLRIGSQYIAKADGLSRRSLDDLLPFMSRLSNFVHIYEVPYVDFIFVLLKV